MQPLNLKNTRDGVEKRNPKRRDLPHFSVEIRKQKEFTLMSEQSLETIESTTQKTHHLGSAHCGSIAHGKSDAQFSP
jgi:hypothetical protein